MAMSADEEGGGRDFNGKGFKGGFRDRKLGYVLPQYQTTIEFIFILFF